MDVTVISRRDKKKYIAYGCKDKCVLFRDPTGLYPRHYKMPNAIFFVIFKEEKTRC